MSRSAHARTPIARRKNFAPTGGLVPLLIVVASWGPMAGAQDAEPADDTASIARQYVELVFGDRDLDGAMDLMAAEAWFVDPTAEVWGGPLATGVEGRERIRAIQDGFQAEAVHYDREVEFVSGEYACFAGLLDWTSTGAAPLEDVPFATILRVRGGRVVERHDFGDYASIAPEAPVAEPDLEAIARKYVEAYVERRFDALHDLLADDAVFVDPTSVALSGAPEALPIEGREGIEAMFRTMYGRFEDFSHERRRSFFFGHHAVFAGTARFSIPGAMMGIDLATVEFKDIPMLAVVEVRGGVVVRHTSYLGYDLIMKQMRYWMEEI